MAKINNMNVSKDLSWYKSSDCICGKCTECMAEYIKKNGTWCDVCKRIKLTSVKYYISNNEKRCCIQCIDKEKFRKTFTRERLPPKATSIWDRKHEVTPQVNFHLNNPPETRCSITIDGVTHTGTQDRIMAIRNANMGRKQYLSIAMPFGDKLSQNFPMVFVFKIVSPPVSSSFTDKSTGSAKVNTSMDIITCIHDVNGNRVHQDICKLYDIGIIDAVKREFGTGNPVNSVGFYIVDGFAHGNNPNIVSFFVTPEGRSTEDVVKEGFDYLRTGDPDCDMIQKMKGLFAESDVKAGYWFNNLCLVSRFSPSLLESLLKKGGEFNAPASLDEIPF